MDGVELACRYSFRPNILGLCGPQSDFTLFNYVIKKDRRPKETKRLLKKFLGAFAYYQLIAQANKITDPFDYRVVEAYWIGNSLLKRVQAEEIKKMILNNFTGPGLLNNNIAKNLIKKLLPRCVPHHSFHVFYLGSVTGIVPKNLKTFNSCFISWGKVKEIKGDYLIVLRANLKREKNKIVLGKPFLEKVLYKMDNKSFIKNLHLGDWVSIHWNWACQRLNKQALERLRYWTLYNLKVINRANEPSR